MLAMNSIKNVTFVKWKNYFRWVSAASCRASLTRTVAHRGCIAEILESVICHEDCGNKNIAESLKSWINNWFKSAYKRVLPQIEFKSMLKLLKWSSCGQLQLISALVLVPLDFRQLHPFSVQTFEAFCTCLLALQHFITLFIAVLSMYFLIYFLNFLTLVSSVVCLCTHPSSRFSHVCRLSLFSPSFSAFLSLSLLCWSLWLILKGNRESEWDLKEREALCSTQQGRPSLDWNTARKRGKKKKHNTHTQHRKTESFFPLSHFLFPPSLYSSLTSLLSCLISHFYSPSAGAQIWAPWTQTRKPPELQCYTSSSIPSSSLFLALPVTFSSRVHQCNVLCLTERQWEKKKVEIPQPTPRFLPIMYSVRLLYRLLSLMRTVLLLFL